VPRKIYQHASDMLAELTEIRERRNFWRGKSAGVYNYSKSYSRLFEVWTDKMNSISKKYHKSLGC